MSIALVAVLSTLALPLELKPYTVEFRVLRVPAGTMTLQKLLQGQPMRVLPANGESADNTGLMDANEDFVSGRAEMQGPQVRVGRTPTATDVTNAVWLVWAGWSERPFGRDYNWYFGPRTYTARTPCSFTASAIAAENGRIELSIGYAAEDLTTPEDRRPLPASLAPFYTPDAPPPQSFVPTLHQQLKVSGDTRCWVTGRGTLKVGETLAVYAGHYATWPASDELLVPWIHQRRFDNWVHDDVIVFATVRE